MIRYRVALQTNKEHPIFFIVDARTATEAIVKATQRATNTFPNAKNWTALAAYIEYPEI